MSEAIVSFLEQYHLSPELIAFFVSMLPIIELRGGIPIASFFGIPLLKAYIICFAGNILPIPFILLFVKHFFALCKKFSLTAPLVNALEQRALRKSDSVQKQQMLGLLAFVAIPLPGTGGWTGALIASLLNMPVKKSFFTIALGVLCAGIIMLIVSYFIPGLFGF